MPASSWRESRYSEGCRCTRSRVEQNRRKSRPSGLNEIEKEATLKAWKLDAAVEVAGATATWKKDFRSASKRKERYVPVENRKIRRLYLRNSRLFSSLSLCSGPPVFSLTRAEVPESILEAAERRRISRYEYASRDSFFPPPFLRDCGFRDRKRDLLSSCREKFETWPPLEKNPFDLFRGSSRDFVGRKKSTF